MTNPNVPIVIRDFSVLSHQIYNNLEKVQQRLRLYTANPLEDKRVQQWVKASWALILNRAPDCLDDQPIFNVIVLDRKSPKYSVPVANMDKGYWRHHYMRDYWAEIDPAMPVKDWCYKYGREEKSKAFYSAASVGSDYLTSLGVPVLSAPGYEADDFAGCLVQHKRMLKVSGIDQPLADTVIYLHTVDTDWLQLVGDGVYFCNTGPASWGARLRGEEEALIWLNKKILKRTLKAIGGTNHPQDIIKMKMAEGDKSDNLGKGSPREVIDLMNPPAQFNIRNRKEGLNMLKLCAASHDNRNRGQFRQAVGYLQANNLPFVIYPTPEAR